MGAILKECTLVWEELEMTLSPRSGEVEPIPQHGSQGVAVHPRQLCLRDYCSSPPHFSGAELFLVRQKRAMLADLQLDHNDLFAIQPQTRVFHSREHAPPLLSGTTSSRRHGTKLKKWGP